MKLGVIIHKIGDSDIFLVHIGWGQVRYFISNNSLYSEGDIILYEDYFSDDSDDNELNQFFESREAWLNDEPVEGNSDDTNEIEVVCRLEECENLGNIRFDFNNLSFSSSEIVIARRDTFVYWEGYNNGEYTCHGPRMEFDLNSNALLFLHLAEPRYKLPDETDFRKAFSDAKRKVEELDIPTMIKELKVEVQTNCWTRRGSDNVEFCHKYLHYNYAYHYDYLHDSYLDAIFPKYKVNLYESRDGDTEYIHPDYVDSRVIRDSNGNIDLSKATFQGIDIDSFCEGMTEEMRAIALKNFDSYNKMDHITSLAYSHLYWSQIFNFNEDNTLILKFKGKAELIWGFKHDKLCENVNIRNFKEIITENNNNHQIPNLN